jgi:hypothetical protein
MDQAIPVDPEVSQSWAAVAIGSRVSHRTLELVGAPAPGSRFAQVDAGYPYEQVSERARGYLAAALEHLIFWADYVAPIKFHDEQAVHLSLRPSYTIARASVESSAQAVWLMNAADPKECIRRHLCLVRWDLQEYRKSKLEPAAKDVIRAQEAELVHRVSAVFSEEQIRPPYGYLEVIRNACSANDLALAPDDAERLWRAASGAAHGKHWPNVELRTTVVAQPASGNPQETTVPDPIGIRDVLEASYRMTQYGVLRFADHSGADLRQLSLDATLWVSSRLPFRTDLPAGTVEQITSEVIARHTAMPAGNSADET